MINERTDIHRPSEIIPSNYDYVAVWTMNIQGIGDCQFILREREISKAHMARTGGHIVHKSNGSCGVCGNVQAIYLVLFHHKISNDYIVVGVNCAQKLEMGFDFKAMELFKRRCADAREQQAGKRKAIALLSDAGLIDAWEVFNAACPQHIEGCPAAGRDMYGDDNGAEIQNVCNCDFVARYKLYMSFPESTIRDIIGKLVRYGNISEKQSEFVHKLLKQIADRPIVEAQRKAEADAAGPVPVGRTTMTGVVVGMKEVEGQSFSYGDNGIRTKLIIKLENGSKVYGNRFNNLEKGDTVTFIATVEASKTDTKFGFYKRATLPKRELSKDEKKAVNKLKKVLKTVPYAPDTAAWLIVNELINDISAGKYSNAEVAQ